MHESVPGKRTTVRGSTAFGRLENFPALGGICPELLGLLCLWRLPLHVSYGLPAPPV